MGPRGRWAAYFVGFFTPLALYAVASSRAPFGRTNLKEGDRHVTAFWTLPRARDASIADTDVHHVARDDSSH